MLGFDEKASVDGETIAQLKERFSTEKVQILTVLPQS